MTFSDLRFTIVLDLFRFHPLVFLFVHINLSMTASLPTLCRNLVFYESLRSQFLSGDPWLSVFLSCISSALIASECNSRATINPEKWKLHTKQINIINKNTLKRNDQVSLSNWYTIKFQTPQHKVIN